jgi:hypothetical protein
VGAVGPLGQVPREHVPHPRQRVGGARHVAQADELPVALPLLQLGEALVPRAAAAATPRWTCCTATRCRARCRGSRACGSSRRTTATSSSARTRSRRRCSTS